MTTVNREAVTAPFFGFNFDVQFFETRLPDGQPQSRVAICGGAFSEVSGIEATMEPKVIKEGGRNYGDVQRVGPVTFSTVILKRGVTQARDLFTWFDLVAGGSYAKRLNAKIIMKDSRAQPVHELTLLRALPIKFKAADFNSMATAVAIEELHIAHEGLQLRAPSGSGT